MVRLVVLAAALVPIVFVPSASGSPSRCRQGSSSVGPAVLVHNHLARSQSDLVPRTKGCLAR